MALVCGPNGGSLIRRHGPHLGEFAQGQRGTTSPQASYSI